MAQTTAPAKKLKTADRQEILSKVLGILKKKYKTAPPKTSRPIMEALMFGILLEDAPHPIAEAAYDRMFEAFFDLNEIRVSSVSEIEDALGDIPSAGWRALRIREILQFAFEKFFAFDLEPLKRKTLELAEKSLDKIKYLTPFAREYALLQCFGAHSIPLDATTLEFLSWLGLATADDHKHSAEDLRSIVRKADIAVFFHLVHSLASDPMFQGAFRMKPSERTSGGGDPTTAVERLTAIIASGGKRPVAKSIKKPAKAEAPARPERKPKQSGSARKVAKAKPASKTKRK